MIEHELSVEELHAVAVGRGLAVAAGIDPRMPRSDPDGFIRATWVDMLRDVPAEVIEQAVKDYYRSDRFAQKRETIAPADVVQWWNARRPPTERERTGLNRATERKTPRAELDPQRHRDGVDRVLAAWQGARAIRRGDDPDYAMEIAQGETAVRREFLSRPCPHCGAGEGSPCVVPSTGERLTKSPAHDARINAAQVAAAGTRGHALAELENVVVAAETLSSP
ncbi:zinc finger domain-containing protein [Saccharothrix stipae]